MVTENQIQSQVSNHAETKAVFELRNVSKSYKLGLAKVEALKGINLKFTNGDFIAIAGPSGSGKTSLLNILGCLDIPTQGEVIIDDQLLIPYVKHSEKQKMKIRREKIGFIFQKFNLIPILNVYENVEYPLLLLKISSSQRRKLVEKALEETGLQHRAKHLPNRLSGGEQQRVSIARALVKRPKLILADEPTANLDLETGLTIIELMSKLNREEGVTFVFSTHDSQILKVTERVIWLRDGVIQDDGRKNITN